MLIGIIFGLLAAVFQSFAYISSRFYSNRHQNSMISLLVFSHIIMGVFSIIILFFVRPADMPPLQSYGLTVLYTAGFYLLGQLFLFEALKCSQPSRVSPLLGIKVFILAIMGFLFLNQHFGIFQWAAVLLSSVSAILLSQTGDKIGTKAIIMVSLASFFYCISDLNIKILVNKFEYLGLVRGCILSSVLSYILCGLFAVVAMPFVIRPMTLSRWGYSVPFALLWFAAMITLFLCFSIVGVVYGNILQSTRGILSICFGFILAHNGFEFLDTKISKKVFVQRFFAAILMLLAIMLFYLG